MRLRARRAPPVFLDRDGTLIVEKHYLSDPQEVHIEDGVVEGLSMLMALGHPLIVLSNQSGIGRGMFGASDARRVNARVEEILRAQGVTIMAWYVCPHAPDSPCVCRKPLPGMALEAAREWGLELPGAFVIGDKRSDLELADAIGGTGILLTTGHGRKAAGWARAQSRPVFEDLRGAAAYISQLDGAGAPQ
jgi:histidinol-phosphate phosphatase family protein